MSGMNGWYPCPRPGRNCLRNILLLTSRTNLEQRFQVLRLLSRALRCCRFDSPVECPDGLWAQLALQAGQLYLIHSSDSDRLGLVPGLL